MLECDQDKGLQQAWSRSRLAVAGDVMHNHTNIPSHHHPGALLRPLPVPTFSPSPLPTMLAPTLRSSPYLRLVSTTASFSSRVLVPAAMML
jgi:hypothetical protein